MMRLSLSPKNSSSLRRKQISRSTVGQFQTLKKHAVVVKDISAKQPGRLKYQSTFWFGRSIDPNKTLKAGQKVEVCFREGNTWFVKDSVSMAV